MSERRGNSECRIYVGNLPPDIRTKDIQDLFHKFGKVQFVDLKNRRGIFYLSNFHGNYNNLSDVEDIYVNFQGFSA